MTATQHTTPLDALVAEVVNRLDAPATEAFYERAAIREYSGQQPRALAEALALIETLVRWPSALSGLVVLEVEQNGATQWLLTTDLTVARRQLSEIGAVEIAVLDPADVVREQYGDLAVLSTELG